MIRGHISKVRICKSGAEEHGIVLRFHLSYDPQSAGLIERKIGKLKKADVIKDKTTLAGWTTVLSRI